MIQGTVKWFNNDKGFGFIQANNKDYFLHFKEIQKEGFKTVNEGDKVSFEPASTPKGLTAKSVQLI